MASKVRVEAGNQLLCAMTADDIAKATNQPINEVLEDFMMSTTASEIFDLRTHQRFYGPAALVEEYLGKV